MAMHTLDRRQLLAGACGTALLLASGQTTEAAKPLRIIGKAVGGVVKAVGKIVKISISLAIAVGTFVWNGSVGVFDAVIGQTKIFVINVAGMTVRLVMKATTQYVEVAGKVAGAFGTLTDTIIVNL